MVESKRNTGVLELCLDLADSLEVDPKMDAEDRELIRGLISDSQKLAELRAGMAEAVDSGRRMVHNFRSAAQRESLRGDAGAWSSLVTTALYLEALTDEIDELLYTQQREEAMEGNDERELED